MAYIENNLNWFENEGEVRSSLLKISTFYLLYLFLRKQYAPTQNYRGQENWDDEITEQRKILKSYFKGDIALEKKYPDIYTFFMMPAANFLRTKRELM